MNYTNLIEPYKEVAATGPIGFFLVVVLSLVLSTPFVFLWLWVVDDFLPKLRKKK